MALPISIIIFLQMASWNEAQWSAHLCKKQFGLNAVRGKTVEVQTPDGARVDILTKDLAIEVDWCSSGKWSQAIGQSIFYANAFNRKPAIVLLMKNSREKVYYLRALSAAKSIRPRIKVFLVRVP